MATTEPIYEDVGRRVRRIREARGISQQDLALMAGLSVNYVWVIEAAKRRVSVATLARLADALNVEICDFFECGREESQAAPDEHGG